MEKCKHCGKNVEDNETKCPLCKRYVKMIISKKWLTEIKHNLESKHLDSIVTANDVLSIIKVRWNIDDIDEEVLKDWYVQIGEPLREALDDIGDSVVGQIINQPYVNIRDEILGTFPKPVSKLLTLNNTINSNCYAIARYYPMRYRLHDRVSHWLLKVKENDYSCAAAFGIYAGLLLKPVIDCDCVTRALSSSELMAPIIKDSVVSSGLDMTGLFLSIIMNTKYDNQLLSKTRLTPKLTGLSQSKREELINNNYRCKKVRFNSILVVDDVTTYMTTFRHIYQAIVDSNPSSKVTFLAICKTSVSWGKQVLDCDIYEEYLNKVTKYMK